MLSKVMNISHTIKKSIPIASPIHRGHSTHHHGHVITLQSLRIMNASPKRPGNPMPEILFDFDMMLLFLLCI
jgi:hypothetical protein